MRWRKPGVILASVAIVVGTGIGVASASVPDSSGVIHGCYVTSGPKQGALTIVDTGAGQTCPSGTAPLNWNSLSTAEYMVQTQGTVAPSADGQVTASCNSGDVVTGGGFLSSEATDLTIFASAPYATTPDEAHGWQAVARNNTASTRDLSVYAFCMHQSAP